MRSSRVAAVATLLALTTALAACGDDGDSNDSDSDDKVTETVSVTPSASETTSAPPTTEVTTSVTPMDPTGDVTQEQVEAALLTPEEVAPGLVLGQWTNEDSPPPCDQSALPVDEQIPPSVEAGVDISTADGNASMEEEIAVYATEEEAGQAFAVGSAGLDCSTATAEDGSSVTIGPATDVTADVNGASGLGTSTAWEISGEGFTAVLVATLSSRIVMANTFVVADGADTSTLPTPLQIAAAAFAKALAS